MKKTNEEYKVSQIGKPIFDRALEEATAYLTENFCEDADIVLVNTSCRFTWHYDNYHPEWIFNFNIYGTKIDDLSTQGAE